MRILHTLTRIICLLLIVTALSAEKRAMAITETLYNGVNTNLQGDDNYTSSNIPLGFDFSFYGTNYSQVSISNNGLIIFGAGSGDYTEDPIPSPGTPNNFIAAFWDDLIVPSGKRTILYKTIGEAPNRTFIVQWTNMFFCCSEDIPMGTFQAYLYETTGEIRVQYRTLSGDARAFGNSAAIGVENSTGSAGVQYSYHTNSITEGQSIQFIPSGVTYTVLSDAEYQAIYLLDPLLPSVPALVSPSSAITNITTSPTFTWNTAEQATSYRVLISTVPTFASTVVNQGGLTTTSYAVTSGLTVNTTYYWRIEAINTNGSTFSETRTFTTLPPGNTPPENPSSLGPVGFTTNVNSNDITPTLNFTLSDNDEEDTVQYQIQIDDTSDFSSPVVDYTSSLATPALAEFTVGQPLNNGTYTAGSPEQQLSPGSYYWRVSAYDNHGIQSGFSIANTGSQAFTIIAPTPTTSPSPSPSPTSSPSVTPSPSPSPLPSISPSPLVTPTQIPTITQNPTLTIAPRPTRFYTTPTPTILVSPSQTPSVQESVVVTMTQTPTPIKTPTPTESAIITISFQDEKGEMIKNAEIYIPSIQKSVKINDKGVAEFKDIIPGEYSVEINYNGKKILKKIIVPATSTNLNERFSAEPETTNTNIQVITAVMVTGGLVFFFFFLKRRKKLEEHQNMYP